MSTSRKFSARVASPGKPEAGAAESRGACIADDSHVSSFLAPNGVAKGCWEYVAQ